MNTFLRILGLILVVLGAAILIVCFFIGETNNNSVLFSSLALIVIGLIAYIVLNKRLPE